MAPNKAVVAPNKAAVVAPSKAVVAPNTGLVAPNKARMAPNKAVVAPSKGLMAPKVGGTPRKTTGPLTASSLPASCTATSVRRPGRSACSSAPAGGVQTWEMLGICSAHAPCGSFAMGVVLLTSAG